MSTPSYPLRSRKNQAGAGESKGPDLALDIVDDDFESDDNMGEEVVPPNSELINAAYGSGAKATTSSTAKRKERDGGSDRPSPPKVQRTDLSAEGITNLSLSSRLTNISEGDRLSNIETKLQQIYNGIQKIQNTLSSFGGRLPTPVGSSMPAPIIPAITSSAIPKSPTALSGPISAPAPSLSVSKEERAIANASERSKILKDLDFSALSPSIIQSLFSMTNDELKELVAKHSKYE